MGENIVLTAFVLTPLLSGYLLYLFFVRYRIHRRRRTWPWLLTGNLLVLLLPASLLVLGGEVYYRFFYDATDSFGLTKVTARWFQRHYERNAQGFRDSLDYSFPPAPGKRRITFLGDSFTAGHGVPAVEDRFANRIRRRLESDGYEVHVMAKNGWDTGDQLSFLQRSPVEYAWGDLVLVYCLNDIADVLPERDQVYSRIYREARPGLLGRHSYLFNTWHYRLFAARDPDVSDYYRFTIEGYEGSDWELQRSRLAAMRDLVIAKGGQFHVVTFPFLHAIGDDYPYRSIHQQLDRFWQRIEVPHLDLLEIFADLEPQTVTVNPYDAHPNERAHELAADAILSFLRSPK